MVATKKPAPHRIKSKHVAEKVAKHEKHVKHEKKHSAKETTVASDVITIDRRAGRERRDETVRNTQSEHPVVKHEKLERRAKVNRRRQIDPTTCERDYSPDEIEFMGAIDEYKRRSGRMFPTCSEVLEVIKSLGYVKCPQTEAPVLPDFGLSSATSSNPVAV